MPPRFAYWTIIVEGKPTAFRAQDRDDLVPTWKQLQNKHPDAVMMWFTRGRLWSSPDEARAAERRGGGDRRGQDWRPGGEHRDPRARFDIPRDEKRRRFAERMRRDPRDRPGEPESQQRGKAGSSDPAGQGERPWRPKPDRRPAQQGNRGDRPWRPGKPGPHGRGGPGASDPAARGDRPRFENRSDRPPQQNRGDRPWRPGKPGQGRGGPGASDPGDRGEKPWRPKKPQTKASW